MNRTLISLPLTLTLGAVMFAAGAVAQDGAVAQPKAETKSVDEMLKTALTVGKPAPALKVAGWLKGDAVSEFKAGQVYVVEGWATWCGPCKVSIPHLTELQHKYGDKVTFIGVSVWEQDWDGVPKFVKEMGEQMDYRVAFDKNSDFQKSWMEAGMQNGIPAAFVVNQKGVIAWIGHPMELDNVLPKVVDQSWDLSVAQADSEKQIRMEAKRTAIADKADAVNKKIEKALRADKKEEALGYIDELLALDSEMFFGAAVWKSTVLMKELNKPEEAQAYIRAKAEGELKDNAEALNGFAWCIVEGDEGAKRDLNLALKLATRADELTKGREPNVKDTLARAYFLKGDLDNAIKTEEAALSLVQDDKEQKDEIQKTLDTYRAAKNKK